MEKLKGLRCSIYKNNSGDCSNGGLSSKAKGIILIPPEGEEFNDCRIFEADDEHPAFKVNKRIIRSQCSSDNFIYVQAEPVEPKKKGNMGYMYGGNILYSSDSRWKKITGVHYPIKIHDRQETPEEFRQYSA